MQLKAMVAKGIHTAPNQPARHHKLWKNQQIKLDLFQTHPGIQGGILVNCDFTVNELCCCLDRSLCLLWANRSRKPAGSYCSSTSYVTYRAFKVFHQTPFRKQAFYDGIVSFYCKKRSHTILTAIFSFIQVCRLSRRIFYSLSSIAN